MRLTILNLIIRYETELVEMRKKADAIDTEHSSHGYEQYQIACSDIKTKELVVLDLLNTLL